MVEVTQADREVASALYKAWQESGGRAGHATNAMAETIRIGMSDDGMHCQAFARHREEATADLLAALELNAIRFARIKEMLEGGLLMTGTQRASFANHVWHMECEARAAIARARTGAA